MSAPLALIEDGPVADGRVVALRGEIDVGSTPSLREWLARASEGGRQSLVVDLTNAAPGASGHLTVSSSELVK